MITLHSYIQYFGLISLSAVCLFLLSTDAHSTDTGLENSTSLIRFTLFTLGSSSAKFLSLSAVHATCSDIRHTLWIAVKRQSISKTNQISNWGVETCTELKSTSSCLLAIPAFDRIAGLYNRHLNSNREICLRYWFESQAEGLDWSCQRLIMGGVNFAWLSVWILRPYWFSRKLGVCDYFQVLRRSRHAWETGVRAVPRLCIVHPGICFTTE